MRLVKIGVAAVSVKVGDFPGNAARLKEAIAAAREQKVHLLVTPELAISGYSLEDRIYWPDIARRSWESLEEMAAATHGMDVFVGLPVRMQALTYNAAAFVSDGNILGLVLKRHLPTYSIFYEGRNWTPWLGGVTQIGGFPAGDLIFKTSYGAVTAEICEDLWSANSPARERVAMGAEIVCNLSASPFTPRKNEERKRLIQTTANNLKSVYAYANLLGCDNSRLVFDGGGIVAVPGGIVGEGKILSKYPWSLATAVVDLDDIERQRGENTTWRQGSLIPAAAEVQFVSAPGRRFALAALAEYVSQMPQSFYEQEAPVPTGAANPFLDELFDALVLGLRDYYEKVGVFDRYIVALSGGRDSALCLLLAVEAAKSLGHCGQPYRYAQHVSSVYLPNRAYSSDATETAARALAGELGVPFEVVSITEECELAYQKAIEMVGGEEKVSPIARQNLQARVRAAMILNWANSVGGLVLVTSNLSEAAVGYTTTGGDNQGGFSPIANLPKTLVTRLLDYIAARDGMRSLERILTIPPSAELAEDQEDEKDLMPYVVLDDLLHLYAARRLALRDCWRILCHRHPNHTPEELRGWTGGFARRFTYNQWKRDQHPVALKVMDLDLDPKTGFRFPVTQSIRHELDELEAAELE